MSLNLGPIHIVQDDLPILRALITSVKTLFPKKVNIYRFQGLGCGHIFGGTTIQPSTGTEWRNYIFTLSFYVEGLNPQALKSDAKKYVPYFFSITSLYLYFELLIPLSNRLQTSSNAGLFPWGFVYPCEHQLRCSQSPAVFGQ